MIVMMVMFIASGPFWVLFTYLLHPPASLTSTNLVPLHGEGDGEEDAGGEGEVAGGLGEGVHRGHHQVGPAEGHRGDGQAGEAEGEVRRAEARQQVVEHRPHLPGSGGKIGGGEEVVISNPSTPELGALVYAQGEQSECTVCLH